MFTKRIAEDREICNQAEVPCRGSVLRREETCKLISLREPPNVDRHLIPSVDMRSSTQFMDFHLSAICRQPA